MSKSSVVLNQVHLYTNAEFNGNGEIKVGINDIFRVDVYGFDKAATKQSRITSIVGISLTAGAVVGAAVIVANSMAHMFDGMTISLHD